MARYIFVLLGTILVEFILAPLGGRVFDYFFPEERGFADMMPDVPFYQWGYFSILALGFVGGIGMVRWQDKRTKTRAGAVIELLIYADGRHAESVREENIYRWSILDANYEVVRPGTGVSRRFLHTILFVIFDVPVENPLFRVSGRNMIVPRHQLRFANERYVVAIFEGPIPPGTLIVAVNTRRPGAAGACSCPTLPANPRAIFGRGVRGRRGAPYSAAPLLHTEAKPEGFGVVSR